MTKRYSKILLVCLIIIGVSYAPVFRGEQLAQAGPLGTFGGILGNCLKSVVIGAILNFGISFIVGLIFGKVPTFDSATFQQMLKEYVKDPLARCIARGVFDEVVGHMLNVVRKGGRDGNGSASFVRNWRNFQTKAQYRGEDVFRGILASTPVCDYLRSGLNRSYGVTSQANFSLAGINLRLNNLNPFPLRAKCPLPQGFNISAYQQNRYANGGWDTFNRMLMPQGNPLDLELLAQYELQANRLAEEQADLNEAKDGYLGTRGTNTNGPVQAGNSCSSSNSCPSGLTCSYGATYGKCAVSNRICDTTQDCAENGVIEPGNFCQGTCTITNNPAPGATPGPSSTPSPGGPGAQCTYNAECTSNQCLSNGVCAGGGNTSEPACLTRGANGQCTKYSDIRTPGSSLKDTVQAEFSQELAWITNVDELKELVVGFIWDRLFNRVKDLSSDEQKPTYNNSETGDQQGDDTSWESISQSPPPTPIPTVIPPGEQSCNPTGSAFSAQVNAAIDQYIAANPAKFDGINIIGDTDPFVQGVAAILNSAGLQSHQDPNAGEGDEIEVKNSATFSESWDIMVGSKNSSPDQAKVRRFYVTTCTPATPY